MRLWEIHNMLLDGAIRTTPDGEADIGGLVLSEKAYLVAVREYRPGQLVELVERHGPDEAADVLVARFAGDARCLKRMRSRIGGPGVVRADETSIPEPALHHVV